MTSDAGRHARKDQHGLLAALIRPIFNASKRPVETSSGVPRESALQPSEALGEVGVERTGPRAH